MRAREKKEEAKGPTATNKYEGERGNGEHENERKREKNGEGEIGGSALRRFLRGELTCLLMDRVSSFSFLALLLPSFFSSTIFVILTRG